MNGNGGVQAGGGASGGRLKEEILQELEKRVSLSCSSCQVGVESLLRQQQKDQERIGALEKQMNLLDVQHSQLLLKLHQEVQRAQTCCDAVGDLRSRISQNERKISSAVESIDGVQTQLERALSGGVGSTEEGSGSGVLGRLDHQLKHLEQQINKTWLHSQHSCSSMKNEVKSSVHRELEGLRAHLLDRFDSQLSRITGAEADLGLLKDQLDNQHQKLLALENHSSLLALRIQTCACLESDNGDGGRLWPHGGYPGNKTGGGKGEAPGQVGGASGANEQGGLLGRGGERGNATEKSLEWRVVANENQIRHFSTRLKDLSVSGDSLSSKVSSSILSHPTTTGAHHRSASCWIKCL